MGTILWVLGIVTTYHILQFVKMSEDIHWAAEAILCLIWPILSIAILATYAKENFKS